MFKGLENGLGPINPGDKGVANSLRLNLKY